MITVSQPAALGKHNQSTCQPPGVRRRGTQRAAVVSNDSNATAPPTYIEQAVLPFRSVGMAALAGIAAGALALSPSPAQAAVMPTERPHTETLGVDQRTAAAELQEIVKRRTGKDLPSLTISPTLRELAMQEAEESSVYYASSSTVGQQQQELLAKIGEAKRALESERQRSEQLMRQGAQLRKDAEAEAAKLRELQTEQKAKFAVWKDQMPALKAPPVVAAAMAKLPAMQDVAAAAADVQKIAAKAAGEAAAKLPAMPALPARVPAAPAGIAEMVAELRAKMPEQVPVSELQAAARRAQSVTTAELLQLQQAVIQAQATSAAQLQAAALKAHSFTTTEMTHLHAAAEKAQAAAAKAMPDLSAVKDLSNFRIPDLPADFQAPLLAAISPAGVESMVSEGAAAVDRISQGLPDGAAIPLAGAAVGGIALLSRQQSRKSQEHLSEQLEAEKAAVRRLQAQAEEAAAAVAVERQLVDQLLAEAHTSAEATRQLLELEQAQKENATQETALLQSAYASSRQLADALRQEAAQNAEMMVSERRAKQDAETLAVEMQRRLEETRVAMVKEREVAMRVGADTMAVSEELREAKAALGHNIIENVKLQEELAAEKSRAEAAEQRAAAVSQQLAATNSKMEEQRSVVTHLEGDALSMKDSMTKLKAQAAEMAQRAQRDAEERQRLEERYRALSERFDKECAGSKLLKSQLAASLKEQNGAYSKIQELQDELDLARSSSSILQAEVNSLNAKVEATSGLLAAARVTNTQMAADVDGLKDEISGLKKQLASSAMELQNERSSGAATKQQLDTLKQEFKAAGYALESAKDEAKELRSAAKTMERQIGELKAINHSATLGAAAVKEQYGRQMAEMQQKLQAVQNEKEDAESLAQELAAKLTEAMEQTTKLQEIGTMAINKLATVEADYNNRLGTAMAEIKALRGAQEQASMKLEGSQARLAAAESEVAAERARREEVTTTMSKLQATISAIKEEIATRKLEAQRARLELELERSARLAAESEAARLRQQLDGARSDQKAGRMELESDIEAVRAELAAARARRAGRAGVSGPLPTMPEGDSDIAINHISAPLGDYKFVTLGRDGAPNNTH